MDFLKCHPSFGPPSSAPQRLPQFSPLPDTKLDHLVHWKMYCIYWYLSATDERTHYWRNFLQTMADQISKDMPFYPHIEFRAWYRFTLSHTLKKKIYIYLHDLRVTALFPLQRFACSSAAAWIYIITWEWISNLKVIVWETWRKGTSVTVKNSRQKIPPLITRCWIEGAEGGKLMGILLIQSCLSIIGAIVYHPTLH